jgi:GNAT superfamily N-acetyltransferase
MAFVPSKLYCFVRSRQLEGTYPGVPGTGTWVTTVNRVSRGYGMVEEGAWKQAAGWPPVEPVGLDELAKKRPGATLYQRVRDLAHLKRLLDRGHPALSAFAISVNEWYAATDGIIKMPSSPIDAGHGVVIEGYDDATGRLRFWNSWGRDWGDNEYGHMPYDYYDAFVTEALVRADFRQEYPESHASPFVCLAWDRDAFGERSYIIETYEPTTQSRVGWCFAVRAEGFLDVEEFFIMPRYRQRGHAKKIRDELAALARRLNLPIRVWIAHPDAAGNEITAKLLLPIGLAIGRSPVRWASYLASPMCARDAGAQLPPPPAYQPPANALNFKTPT